MRLQATRLTAIAHAVRRLFSPASLFTAGEQGVWYDPSNFSTMFQDAAGTTPATAVEQPVGLILDKSKGLVLGPELVTNGTFAENINGWAAGSEFSSISWVAGKLRVSTTSTLSQGKSAYQPLPVVAGKTYKISGNATIVEGSFTTVHISLRDGVSSATSNPIATTVLTMDGGSEASFIYTATSTTTLYIHCRIFNTTAPATVDYDNISVRELPGNHATQTTATSRPVLSARVNLLTATETLATQTVTTMATTQRLRFEGTGTITLSGAATGTYSAGSHTFTTTAGNLTLTVSGTVTKADLRAANDALNQPAYQRVNTATDYDTAGFKPYLRFDGTDDWLVTPSIDFTATDKMTVFAGVRKMSSNTSVIIESGSNWADNNGAFVFATAGSIYALDMRTGGILSGVASPENYPPPNTSMLSISLDIPGDSMIIRANGAQIAQTLKDLGVGVFANLPLFIGRRAGTTFPFNGRLYGLVVRGAASTAVQIQQTEAWLNQRTGAY